MSFIERLLNLKGAPPAEKELRRAARYAISPTFPLKAVLNLMGRDDMGELLASADGRGWDWTGSMVNFSSSGASMYLPPASAARRGDVCRLTLSLADHQIGLPCRVAHARAGRERVLFGLHFDFAAEPMPPEYQQLLELVALGASLEPDKTAEAVADESGYLAEHYCGDYEAHLTVWRKTAGGAVQWFEYHFGEYLVRGRAGTHGLEIATVARTKSAQTLTPSEIEEIRQFLVWVVPNLSKAVPTEVRNCLQAFVA